MNPASVLLCVILAAAPAARAEGPTQDEIRQFLSQPHVQLKSYAVDPKSALESRIKPAPEFLLKVMRGWDQRPDYGPYDPTPAERRLLMAYVKGLPAGMRKTFEERLVGFFFIKPFTGNGIGMSVVDEQKKVHGLIILNPEGFSRGLSEVLTARDASVFKGDAGVRIDCGSRDKGILYTLLHEGTHIFDYIHGLTPYVDVAMDRMLHEGRGRDAKWDAWDGYSKPRPDADFPLRSRLRFFGLPPGPQLEPKDAPALYRQLDRSPFASLYASQSWAEDAAELGVFYHLTQSLKRNCEALVPGPGGKPARHKLMGSKRALERGRKLYRRLEK